MLELSLVFAFTAHLVAVNVAAAGPLYCVAIEWRGTRHGNLEAVALGRRLAIWSLVGFVAGILLGAALLAVLWHADRSYWAALRRVPAHRWWFFGGELIFYLVCMVAYVWLWDGSVGTHVDASAAADADASLGETHPRGRWWHRLLAVLASTSVLYHFPPLFTMLSLMSTRPELAESALDRSLYVELFTDAETLSRVAHHWLASIATAGVALLLLASWRGPLTQPDTHTESSDGPATFAARVALLATALQLPTGLWLLLVSPGKAQSQLLGGDMATTAIFAAAIFAMVLLLQSLATAALGDSSRSTAVKITAFLLTVILLMSYVLHSTRAKGDEARVAANIDSPMHDRGDPSGLDSEAVGLILISARISL